MNTKKIEQDILKICLNLIYSSKYHEWNLHKQLIVDNISINCYYSYFQIKIYSDNSLNKYLYAIDLAKDWFSIRNNKIGFIKNILLKKKLRDLNKYFDNKKKYDYIIGVYNSLPSKLMRKSKLEKLNN